jgi:hypothetical protein
MMTAPGQMANSDNTIRLGPRFGLLAIRQIIGRELCEFKPADRARSSLLGKFWHNSAVPGIRRSATTSQRRRRLAATGTSPQFGLYFATSLEEVYLSKFTKLVEASGH